MHQAAFAQDWKQILRTNFTNWQHLADFLQLSVEQRDQILQQPRFVLNLPFRLANKIEKGTLDDPILRQFLPTKAESSSTAGYVADPVGDQGCKRGSKLLHKYNGRVLLVTTSACAMHCRYCFRQNFDYDVIDKTFSQELETIAQDSSIKEVILSGGDPLSLSERLLAPLLLRISRIPHIKRIRFHTRFPLGVPERIDADFLKLIASLPQQVWFVIHCNHPNELDDEIFERLKSLQKLGVPVLNQAVLLQGVNDDADTMQRLCEKLIDQGVFPYYLHQLDRVQGAAHFEVPRIKGTALMEDLIKRLPGYGVPKYVQEIAGQPSKTPIH